MIKSKSKDSTVVGPPYQRQAECMTAEISPVPLSFVAPRTELPSAFSIWVLEGKRAAAVTYELTPLYGDVCCTPNKDDELPPCSAEFHSAPPPPPTSAADVRCWGGACSWALCGLGSTKNCCCCCWTCIWWRRAAASAEKRDNGDAVLLAKLINSKDDGGRLALEYRRSSARLCVAPARREASCAFC